MATVSVGRRDVTVPEVIREYEGGSLDMAEGLALAWLRDRKKAESDPVDWALCQGVVREAQREREDPKVKLPVAVCLAADLLGLTLPTTLYVRATGTGSYTAYEATGRTAFTHGGDWTVDLPEDIRAAVREWYALSERVGRANRIMDRVESTVVNRDRIRRGLAPRLPRDPATLAAAHDSNWYSRGSEISDRADTLRQTVADWILATYYPAL